MVELRFINSQTTHLHFLPGRKILTRSLWHAFYKARLDLRVQLWLEGRSLIYGYLRSMSFNNNFTHRVGTFFHRRGLPMSIFALMAVGGTGFGPVYAGWIEMNPKLEWKWIQWIHMMQVIPRSTVTPTKLVTKKI
jgi:hypothetical protein